MKKAVWVIFTFLILVIIVLLMLQVPAINSIFKSVSNSGESNLYQGYTKITVVEGQALTTSIGGYEYLFTYDHAAAQYNNIGQVKGYVPCFYVNTAFGNPFTPTTYPATVDMSYDFSGIKIAVTGVYSNYCTLMVKSTVP